MKKTILPKNIIEQLEKEGFTINEYPEDNSIEFQKYSDAGQDFSFTVDTCDDVWHHELWQKTGYRSGGDHHVSVGQVHDQRVYDLVGSTIS